MLEAILGGHLAEVDQLRRGGGDGVRVTGAGEDQIEVGESLHRAADVRRLAADQVGQLLQDAPDLVLLLNLQLAPGVVVVDGGQRLDPEGGPAGRLVMDNALDLALELRPQGDDVAAAALGDQRLLQVAGVVGVVDDVLQLALQAVEGHAQIAADDRQARAGAVVDLAPVVDHAGDLLLDARALLDQLGDLGQARRLPAQAGQQAAQGGRPPQRAEDVQQRRRLDDDAADGRAGRFAHVKDAAQRDIRPQLKQQPRLGGLLLALQRLVQVGRRAQGAGQLPPAAEVGIGGQLLQDFGQLKDFEGLLVHGRYCT